ncbi:MAG: hypothetical protein GX162_12840 [Firmicutes bacterium]|nr:hypothetical protein [Bacillota bacterium]
MTKKRVLQMGLLRTALTVMGLLVLATATVSAADEPLRLTLEQFAVIPPQEEGASEELVPFTEEMAEPGTVIEYHLVARNMTGEPIKDIILQLLVPQGTHYLDGQENYDRSTLLLQFSIDGGETFRTPPIRYITVTLEGRRVQAVATADMYTDLRLVFLAPLAAHEEVRFSYRVEID